MINMYSFLDEFIAAMLYTRMFPLTRLIAVDRTRSRAILRRGDLLANLARRIVNVPVCELFIAFRRSNGVNERNAVARRMC